MNILNDKSDIFRLTKCVNLSNQKVEPEKPDTNIVGIHVEL
jgi:hypothetical protein